MRYIGLPLLALSMSSAAFAGSMGDSVSNQSGLYAGLGGAYNWTRTEADVAGRLRSISGFPPNGVFRGRIGNHARTDQVFSPELHLGYFEPIDSSDWLWGLDLTWQYSGINTHAATQARALDLYNANANITNRVVFDGIQTKVKSVFMLPAFVGHNYSHGFAYLGFGPSVFKTERSFGTARDDASALYIGAVNGFSRTQWLWGGAAQLGATYYLNPSWFLKLNYTYARTSDYNNTDNLAFSPAINGGLNTGDLRIASRERLVAQEVALSINKVFSL